MKHTFTYIILAAALLPACVCLAADATSEQARDHGLDTTLEAMQRDLAACAPNEHTRHVDLLLQRARKPELRARIDLLRFADFENAFQGAVRDRTLNVHERKVLQHRYDAMIQP